MANMIPTLTGSMQADPTPSTLPGGTTYVASAVGDALSVPAPAMTAGDWLTFDLLVSGKFAAVFELRLWQGEGEPFRLIFSALNECSARVRLPLTALSQNAWGLAREGAWLKPTCGGAAVEPEHVTRIELALLRHDGNPVRFAITPILIVHSEPPRLEKPVLPEGKLLDELGQSLLHDWPTRTRSEGEMIDRLRQQDASIDSRRWPAAYSRWGGWAHGPKLEANGFFRTHHDGRRWWLVDPDGCLFWSAGIDCVAPNVESTIDGIEDALTWVPPPTTNIIGRHGVNYLVANFMKAFGSTWGEKWQRITLSHLRDFGFNTVGNWSHWEVARAAGFPYVRPLAFKLATPMVFREFPDVYHPDFTADCDAFARQLQETRDDPAMIGYFLMNEPTWGFASQTPAEGMLINTAGAFSRAALADFLRQKYAGNAELAGAWGMRASFERIAAGRWADAFTPAARADLEVFSTVMVDRLMRGLSDACRRVDPNHQNLGARYYTVPPAWALKGMNCFDVFSINCYNEHVPEERLAAIAKVVDRPVIIGEWHFGALDAGLPASGIGRVATQADRGSAFRVYTETAAVLPQCVGVHYFTLYDQSAVGRFDGEHYNIGFLDVCNRVYEPLALAARASHERLYDVATGRTRPFDTPPVYLPKLFI